jgi:hypothetical protein
MRRSTSLSAYFSLIRAGSASALVLAIALSCSDATSPNGDAGPALKYIEILVPDSIKNALGVPNNGLGNVVVGSSNSVNAPVSASLTSDVAAPAYLKSKPDTTMEDAPVNRIVLPPAPGGNDGYVPDVPLGFNFSFYGTSYDKLNVFANGLVTFGTADLAEIQARLGYYSADRIPDVAGPNNMIALAWSDWSPARAGVDAIRYETRGTAPNRRFILQYTNVPEFGSFALMTVQLVLNEGSNKITIFAPTMSTTRSVDLITQGIENAAGTEATYDSTFHPILLEWYPRVRGFFKLTNDVVRFTPAHVNLPPVIIAPANIEVPTAPPVIAGSNARLALNINIGVGTCSAGVNPGAPIATDDAEGVTTSGVRSDGLALDAAYPKGVTTITWTATDADGLTATATQTVTVLDEEKPLVTAPAAISTRTDHGLATATVDVGNAQAQDNCSEVVASGVRSDGAELSAPYPIGLTTVTWSATDESGNKNAANQTIDVVGNAAPTILAPSNVSFNTDLGVCDAIVNLGTATAHDDFAGVSVGTPVRSDGRPLSAAYSKGVTTIMWTATDVEGLTATASQTVTVNDNERPSLTMPADISKGNDPGQGSAVVAAGSATAKDNCGELNLTHVRSDGATDGPFAVGLTTITWTATDAAGNTATATQSIIVRDIESPTITVPEGLKVNATSPSGALVSYDISWADNVGVISGSCSPASRTLFPMGPTLVTCSASDAAGHTTVKSFTVTVLGAELRRVSLIDFVLSRDPALPNGTANPLVNQLRAAEGGDCKKMSDFISMVRKKSGDIKPEDVTYMIGEAQSIMRVMGCS